MNIASVPGRNQEAADNSLIFSALIAQQFGEKSSMAVVVPTVGELSGMRAMIGVLDLPVTFQQFIFITTEYPWPT